MTIIVANHMPRKCENILHGIDFKHTLGRDRSVAVAH